jgi:phosphatidylserine decarboxylase
MMKTNNTFVVAKEGWSAVATALGVTLLFWLLDCDLLAFIALLITAGAGYAYRNPEREISYYQEASIVSVADGVIESIETVDNAPDMQGPCYKLVVSSALKDVSILRTPFDGNVNSVSLRHGSRLAVNSRLAPSLNESCRIIFTSQDSGFPIVVEHLSAFSELSVYPGENQVVKQGMRYGLMLNGRHTVYLPEKSRVAVKVGDELYAGQTLIGYFA